MRFYEIAETRRGATQGLRQLRAQKHELQRRRKIEDEQRVLRWAMYGNAQRELERLELEKAKLELEQQRVELATAKMDAQKAGAAPMLDVLGNVLDDRQAEGRVIDRLVRREQNKQQLRQANR